MSSSLAQRRILVVDNHQDVADNLSVLLRALGHDTRTAYTGGEAVEVATHYHSEIIFMEHPVPSPAGPRSGLAADSGTTEAYSSGVSWAAVIAGAFVAAALSLVLLALGTGLGLSSVSPWSNVGASASRLGVASIVWLIIVQIVASAMGGYLAGRLRTKWVNVHTDEVFFRDTAHGFLVWAVGVVITAAFLTSAATSMVGGAAHLGATGLATAGGTAMATSAGQSPGQNLNPTDYLVDTLFRSERPSPDANDAAVRTEVGRVFANALRQEEVPAADRTYLAQLVAAKTGLSLPEAEKRVSDVAARVKSAAEQARQAADTARKAAAHALFWTFLAFLIGAFCASYAATIGGRQRDHL
jgi:hypothetical protein